MTVASNQFQSHNQLLRHGMLNWVTRGVFLGYQRNYLELQVDDLFLRRRRLGPGRPTPRTTTRPREPDDAGRRRPRDRLEQARGVRLDIAYNGGGSASTSDGARATRCAKFADPAVQRRVRLHQPHATSTRTWTARRRRSSRGRSRDNLTWATRSSAGAAWRTPGRARHRRALRAGQRPARATRARSIRRRSTTSSAGDRRRAPRRAPTTTRSRRDSAAGETAGLDRAERRGRRRRGASTRASTPSATRSPTTSTAARRAPARGRVVASSHARRRRAPTDDGSDPIELTLTDTGAAGDGRRAARGQRRRARAVRAEPGFLAGARRPPASARSRATRPRPTRTRRPATVPRRAPRSRRARRSPTARRPGRPALPEQRLLQRLAPGPAARRVQLDLRRARRRRRLRADRGRHDLPHDARDVGRVRRPARTRIMFRHVDGQRPAAALLPPEQPRRLQPGAARDRPGPGRHPLPGLRRAARPLRGELRPRERAARAAHATRRSPTTLAPAGRLGGDAAGASRPGCRTAGVHVKNAGAARSTCRSPARRRRAYGGQRSGWISPRRQQVYAPATREHRRARVTGTARVGSR